MSTKKEQKSKLTVIKRKAKRDQEHAWIVPDGASMGNAEWDKTQTVTPLMPPEQLVEVYRKSSEVPKNARARGQNTAGYGWTLESVIDWDDPELTDNARMFIYLDRVAQWRQSIAQAAQEKAESDAIQALINAPPDPPTDAEVDEEIKAWEQRSKMEHALLEIRLRNFCYEYPFEELIRRSEINKGGLAYCGWEVLRDPVGTPIRVKMVEPMHMRPTDEDEDVIAVPWLRETSKVTYEEIQVERRFRRFYVQRNNIKLWYKEFGDPRVVSQQTGKPYPDVDAVQKAKDDGKEEQNAKEATEIRLWSEYSPGAGPCGLPIWHGHSIDVETSRMSKEYDADELFNGKMPRGAFAFIDAAIDSPVVRSFKKFLKEGGIGNRNRVAVLEVATKSMLNIAGAGRAAMEFLDFSKGQHDDATHMKLKEASDSGVSQDFGNPPVLLGASKDVQNRSVAEASQHVAEEQTYTALRQSWDHVINQSFVRPWGFRFWRFQLKGPKLQQPEAVANAAGKFIETNVFRPDEVRPLASRTLGIPIQGEPQPWQKVPPKAAERGLVDDFLPQEDDPLTVLDESQEGQLEPGEKPGETESEGEIDSESARGLLEQLGQFVDGQAAKVRKRLGLARTNPNPAEGPALGPDLQPLDD